MKSGRSGGADRGGIRKRGPTRTDRDGDMDMDRSGARGGKRGRGDATRSTRSTAAGRPQARDKTLDAIQRAISNTQDSQANIRQTKSTAGANLEQFNVTGWKTSKAASNRDGGVESLIAFLERRMNANTKTGPRAKITKVCRTSTRAVFLYQSRRHSHPHQNHCMLVTDYHRGQRPSTLPGLPPSSCFG